MSRVRRLAILLAGLALCGAIALPTRAQQQEAPPTPTAPPAPARPQPVEPIPVADIARQSEEVATRLSQIEENLAPEPAVATIASELSTEAARLSDYRRSAKDPSQLSLRELDEASRLWESAQGQVDAWLGELESRTESLEAMLADLQRLADVWAATERSLSADVPSTVRSNVSEVRGEIARVERLAQSRLSAILTLQSQIADHSSLIRAERSKLDETAAALRNALLRPNAPPLWTAFGEREPEASLVRDAQDSWRVTESSVGQYVTSSSTRWVGQGVLFIALLWLLLWLRQRGAHGEVREELEASARVLSHPFAGALLVALLFTRVIHPLAPPGLYELNRLAILAPLLVLLPGLVFASLRLPLYGLAVLYVFDVVVDFIPEQALLARLAQLLLAGIALAGVLRVAGRGSAAARLELGGFWRAAVLAARLGGALLAISILANLFGLLRLSSLLGEATLSSAYTAVVLFAGVLVLKSLLSLSLDSRLAHRSRTVRAKGTYLRSLGAKLLHFAALVAWLALTLGSLQLLDPLVGGTRAALAATLTLGELSVSVGDVLAFAVAIWLSFIVSRVSRVVLEEDVLPRFSMPRGVPGSISKLAHYAIMLVGLVVALAAAGIQLSRLALVAGALGVGIGFGLQNIVNNFVSGLILLFERPIQVGDTIELQTLFGKVTRIGIRSSTVRTFEGAEVIVPNAHLIDSQVVNWTLSDRLRRIEVTVGVAYGSPPKRVLATLLDVAKQHPDILEQPEPYVLFEGFGDSSLDFVLRAWTAKFDDYLRIRSELRVGVHDALEAAGFEIPFPQRDLHVKSMPPGTAGPTPEPEEDAERGSQ